MRVRVYRSILISISQLQTKDHHYRHMSVAFSRKYEDHTCAGGYILSFRIERGHQLSTYSTGAVRRM